MAYIDHQHVGSIGGLYTSVRFNDRFNANVYKGLPHYIVVAGKSKLASMTIEGIVTDSTSLSGISHSAYATATAEGAGKKVDGIITALELSGSLQKEVTFSVTVEGVGDNSAISSTPEPGTLLFCEDATITLGSTTVNVRNFSITASWDIDWVYDKNDTSFPYPKIADCILKGFEGTLEVDLNAIASLGSTLESVNFSITVGNLTISGTAYETQQSSSDTPDGVLTTRKTFRISTLSIA